MSCCKNPGFRNHSAGETPVHSWTFGEMYSKERSGRWRKITTGHSASQRSSTEAGPGSVIKKNDPPRSSALSTKLSLPMMLIEHENAHNRLQHSMSAKRI